MNKQKYIRPACVVVEMESEDLFLTGSGSGSLGEIGGDFGEKPGEGEYGEADAVGGNPGGGYDVWDD
ncbi:MAG: hypothetical protein K2N13_01380 [Paraprevotella sp.]|nr:hypothetical protein [Paraprevotella sp.]